MTIMLIGAFVALVPLAILIGALLARWAASLFVNDYAASVAGFAFSVGVFVSNSHFYVGLPIGLTVGFMLGQIAGLIAVFYLFFRRSAFKS